MNDSFEEMFTQHDDEFNSQFEPAKKYLKEMSEERPWNYPSASSSGKKVKELDYVARQAFCMQPYNVFISTR